MEMVATDKTPATAAVTGGRRAEWVAGRPSSKRICRACSKRQQQTDCGRMQCHLPYIPFLSFYVSCLLSPQMFNRFIKKMPTDHTGSRRKCESQYQLWLLR